MLDPWLTLAEAAAYLKASKPTLYRLCSESKLPFYKLAGTGARRFKRTDLDALLLPGSAQQPRTARRAPARTSPESPVPAAALTLGPWLDAQMRRLKLTDEALARNLGVATGAVAAWRAGEQQPMPMTSRRLAVLFGVPVEWVLRLTTWGDRGPGL